MTPAIASPSVAAAAMRLLNSQPGIPWPQIWKAIENFCALVLYKLVLANRNEQLSDSESMAILHDQMVLLKASL